MQRKALADSCRPSVNNGKLKACPNSQPGMDTLIIDQAMAFVRRLKDKNHDEVPEWQDYQELVKAHLPNPFNLRFKMPQEYYYAWLRGKGLNHQECLIRMGLISDTEPGESGRKPFWKFWV